MRGRRCEFTTARYFESIGAVRFFDGAIRWSGFGTGGRGGDAGDGPFLTGKVGLSLT